jgi:hypothetical protein
MEVIADPSTVHFHLPGDLSVLVHREYNDFVKELVSKFPHEKQGILKFYGICWKVLSLYSLPVSHTFVLCKPHNLQLCLISTDLQFVKFFGTKVPRGTSIPFRPIF